MTTRTQCVQWMLLGALGVLLLSCGQIFVDEVDGGETSDGAVAEDVRPDMADDGRVSDAQNDFDSATPADSAMAMDSAIDAGPCPDEAVSINPAWNGGEPLVIDFNPGSASVEYTVDPVQPMGTGFLVALQTTTGGNTQPVLLALESDGTRNSSFGTAGRADISVRSHVHSLASARDGGWLISGEDVDPIVIKTTAEGSIEPSFGVAGVARPAPPGATFTSANSIDRFQDGYLVGGQSRTGNFSYWATLLEEDGDVRVTFGANGHALVDFMGSDEFGLTEPSENPAFYYNAGTAYAGARDFDCVITRRRADGQADTTFGTNGVAVAPLDTRDGCPFIVESGGFVYAGGDVEGAMNGATITRFTMDGALDISFGNGGVATLFPTQTGSIRALIAGPDGTLIAAGSSGPAANRAAFVAVIEPEDGSVKGDPALVDLSDEIDEFQSLLLHGNNVLAYGRSGPDDNNALVLVDYRLCI